ncbi:cyclin-dependent kinase-like 2 [Paramuricea clavata]|nr:cyclin-dependent kinase-like 2 [Paramuricea clavata]
MVEMLTGEPLFPGDSDIDQLYHIIKCFGTLIKRHKEIFSRNPLFVGMRLPEAKQVEPLEKRFKIAPLALDFTKQCLRLDPDARPTCTSLLKHEYYTKDNFSEKFATELKTKISREIADNPLLKPLESSDDRARERRKEKKIRKEREMQDRKEHKETRDTREHKTTKEYKDTKERRDSRENKDHKDTMMNNKDHVDTREGREQGDSKDSKDTREYSNDSKESAYNHKENKKAKGWTKDEVTSDRFDKTNRKYSMPIPSHMSSSSQAHTSQLPAMKSDGQPSTFNIWSSYNNVPTDMANTTATGTVTTSSPSGSLEAHNPSQPTNRQLTPINEHRNATNHAIPNYGSRHSISNPLNMTKTNLSFNMNNQKSVEEEAANYGSTSYRSPTESRHKKHSKKSSSQSNQGNMTVYSSEHDQVTPGVETTSSSRLTDSGHERRSSLGEPSRRRSRSRERDKAQEPSFLPDVVGTEVKVLPPSVLRL